MALNSGDPRKKKAAAPTAPAAPRTPTAPVAPAKQTAAAAPAAAPVVAPATTSTAPITPVVAPGLTLAAAPPTEKLPTTPEEIRDYVRGHYGYLAYYVDHPDVGPILIQAAQEGWDANRLRGALQPTAWWQDHSDAYRQWESLKALDPGEADRQRQQRGNEIRSALLKLGVPEDLFPPDKINQLVEDSKNMGWNSIELDYYVGKAVTESPTWRNQSEPSRAYDALARDNPAELERQRAARRLDIQSTAEQLGVHLDPGQLDQMVENTMRLGISNSAQIGQLLLNDARQTDYWKTTSAPDRAFQDLLVNDPAEARRKVDNIRLSVQAQLDTLGLTGVSDEYITAVATDALRYGWSGDQLTQRLQMDVRQTDYFKANAATGRDLDWKLANDPAQARQMIGGKAAEVHDLISRMGGNATGADVDALAVEAIRGNWSDAQLSDAVVDRYVGNGPLGGDALATASSLKSIAKQYMIEVNDAWVTDIVKRIAKGETSIEAAKEMLRSQAKATYPHLAQAIDSGLTAQDYYAPIQNAVANELELNPNAVDFTNAKYSGLMGMSVGDAKRWARDQPAWDVTEKSHQVRGSAAMTLLQKMGAMR